MSIHSLCSIGAKSQPLVHENFHIELAFAAGFPEAFSSSWIGMASLTKFVNTVHNSYPRYDLILKQRLSWNFNTVSPVLFANFYVRDWAKSFIALDPPFHTSCFLISRQRIFSA